MRGLGTIVNAAAIIAGGLCGLLFRRFLKARCQETVMHAVGFAIIVMALGGALSQMLVFRLTAEGQGTLETRGTMMMIVSLAAGALAGEAADLENWFARLGAWLRNKSGNENDSRFLDAFLSATLTVCIGAMAIIGSLQDGISGSHETLYAKAILDFLIVMTMTASLGKGCIFSAIPVAVLQGTITALAGLIEPLMTPAALSNISLVGSVLILCVGVDLIWPKTIRVANVLPAIVIAGAFALV